jgi:glucose/arabinose dehydrogenase
MNQHLKHILSSTLLLISSIVLVSCGSGSNSNTADNDPPPADNPPVDLSCGSIALSQVFTNLTFSQPLGLFQTPGDSSRWYVMERAGRVRSFENTPNVASFDADLIDIRSRVSTSGEGGLLGMAFHPDFASNGEVFFSWTETGAPLISFISRFDTVASGNTIAAINEQQVIALNQEDDNHNGGNIAFGPDGFLYIGFGDGGGGGDPNERAQDPTNLLGSLLRLDVDSGNPFTIPAENPFAGGRICTETVTPGGICAQIYAFGLRNPWRFSFDLLDGTLWLADVGQGTWEEVDQITNGGNYGWDSREGAHCFEPSNNCPTAGLIDPVAEYDHNVGNSITGGYVYRGTSLPDLAGHYVFGDFGSGRIWCLLEDTPGDFSLEELLDSTLRIGSFAQGNDGEIYVLDIFGGGIYQIVSGP